MNHLPYGQGSSDPSDWSRGRYCRRRPSSLASPFYPTHTLQEATGQPRRMIVSIRNGICNALPVLLTILRQDEGKVKRLATQLSKIRGRRCQLSQPGSKRNG